MEAQLNPEASAVQIAIQRITVLCKEWDADCNILINPAIDPTSGKFHVAVKVGEFTMLNSPSPTVKKTSSSDRWAGREVIVVGCPAGYRITLIGAVWTPAAFPTEEHGDLLTASPYADSNSKGETSATTLGLLCDKK